MCYSVIGCGISKSFVLGAECEIYLSSYNLFLQFLYYRIRNKRLRETVVSMLSCSALEGSNNSYIELVLEPCVSDNQKGDLRYVGLIGKKILKKGWGNGKKESLS